MYFIAVVYIVFGFVMRNILLNYTDRYNFGLFLAILGIELRASCFQAGLYCLSPSSSPGLFEMFLSH
jgi:hypothetical protein